MFGTAAARNSSRKSKARSLACCECRDRKVRCDGTRPICDSCSRRGLSKEQCRYPEIETEGSNISSARSHIIALQRRIQQLEAQQDGIASLRYASPPAANPSLGESWSHRSDLEHLHISSHPSPATSTLSTFSNHHHTHQHHHDHVRRDIASAVGFSSGASRRSSIVPGASPPLTDDMDEHVGHDDHHVHPLATCAHYNLGQLSIPSVDEHHGIISSYFTHHWTLMPIVHTPSFYQRYSRLVHTSRTREVSSPRDLSPDLVATYCLLFGMFALGQFSIADREEVEGPLVNDGSHYHDQVRTLLVLDLVSKPCVTGVQALVLHALFLRRRGSLRESRVFAGLARQAASSMRLKASGAVEQSQAEREERRRTWCAVVMVARTCNVNDGDDDSTASGPSLGPLPQDIDDEYLEESPSVPERSQPDCKASITSFFIHTLKLSENVLSPIRTFFFKETDGDDSQTLADIVATVSRLDCSLHQWYTDLPSHLRIQTGSIGESPTFKMLSALMHIQYFETKAFMHRAVITKLVKILPPNDPSSLSFMSQAIVSNVLVSHFSAVTELMDFLGGEGSPLCRSQAIASLCVSGVTLALLENHPIITTPTLDSKVYSQATARCAFLVNRYASHPNKISQHYLKQLRAVTYGETGANKLPKTWPPSSPSASHVETNTTLPKDRRCVATTLPPASFLPAGNKEDGVNKPIIELRVLDSWYRNDLWVCG